MKPLRAFTLVCISLFFTAYPPNFIKSCADWTHTESYRFWLFQPETGNNGVLHPFFYSSDLYYNIPDAPYFGVDLTDEYTQNVKQWSTYLHLPDTQAIYSILYETESYTFFEKQDSLIAKNSFVALLQKKKYASVKTYITFAKRCEVLTNYSDPWACNDCPDITRPSSEQINGYPYEYENERTQNRPLSPIILEGEKLLQQCKDPVLKTRYAFLLVKLYFYSNNLGRGKALYEQYLQQIDDHNWLKASGLLYVATMSPQPESDYLLSKVFAIAPGKQIRCQQLFSLRNEEGALALCKNKQEEAMVKTMQSLQNPGRCLDVIKDIFEKDPLNHTLPVLIVREINKLEDWLLTPKYTEFEPAVVKQTYDDQTGRYVRNYPAESDKVYLIEMQQLLEDMLRSQQKPDPAFLHLCAGYLAFINHDWNSSQSHYALAEKLPANARVKAQLALNKLWLQLSSQQEVNAQTEQHIFNYLEQLQNDSLFADKTTIADQFILAMSDLFIEKGSKAKGLMLLAHTNRAYGDLPMGWSKNSYHMILENASPADYDEMLSIIDKKNKTEFEHFLCTDITPYRWDNEAGQIWNRDKLLDMKTTYYVQHNDIVNAYKTTLLISPDYWTKEPYDLFVNDDPFRVSPWDGHLPMNEGNKVVYNKRTFLEKLLRLQAGLAKATGERKALLYYEIGNAYYSMTWHGKYWIMNRTYWTSNEPFASGSTTFDDMYYGCDIAAVYFRKAMDQSKDPELASVACLMLGNCEENKRRYRIQINDRYSDEAYNDTPNPHLQQLKKKLGNTDYYDELTSNCLLFEKFLARHM